MAQTHSGSCLCGAVRFEVSGAFEHFFLCHCSRCRKDTGSAHAANLFSTTARLIWLSGEDSVTRYRLPGTRHEKQFCRLCGSALPGLHMDGAVLLVPAGSLDSALNQRPDAHVCLSSRANWDDGLDRISGHEGRPEPG